MSSIPIQQRHLKIPGAEQSWEEFLADQVRGPARHDGDAVGAPEDAVSANPGSNVAATPR
ncbi:MAG TPA: hypothetical protein VI055_00795 [Rubrobacter sp.]